MKVSEEFEQALSKFRQVVRTGCWTLVNCGPAKYRCEAFKDGHSCFQHPSTPCCDVNRRRCISCPVFIRLVELPKRPQRVLVTTDGLCIEATFHCPVGMRILDALNVEERSFIALTDVKVSGLGGDGVEREVPFMALSRDQIHTVVPLSGDPEQGAHCDEDDAAVDWVLADDTLPTVSDAD
ncbi:MAG: hypothetical protein JSV65_18350 [Armatimonadota bacterium]|nr:MAG: hypothetical protein JSV65_18350 [Armatimonadota bacterium]